MQDETGPIPILNQQRQEEKLCYKAFERTQAFPPAEHALVFLKRETFLPRLNGELTEQPLACRVPKTCIESDTNKTSSYRY